MVTDKQVRKLMKQIQAKKTMAVASSRAGMDEKTGRKYCKLGRMPSELRKERTWRTRQDDFKEIWPQIEEILKPDDTVQAKTVFEYICRKYPGRFQEGQLRTLQRQMKVWKARQGRPREVMFGQVHEPGRQSQSDFTHMKSLGVTIQGVPFDHLFFHFILPFSNWETGMVCFSEGFESFSMGLQNAFWELGGVPEEHRTDNFSAAVNNLSDKDEWTRRYAGVLSHYKLRATHNYPGNAHENGDVEQSHYRFKEAVRQELILRGTNDFQTRQDYERFLRQILDRRNAARLQKLLEERGRLRPLPSYRLEDCARERARVSRDSTIRVRHHVYSVDSRLIGEKVDVRVYAEHVEVWYGNQKVHEMARLRGENAHAVNYRHVVDSLVRKPGAFTHYRYKSDLFPRLLFRVAYDELRSSYPSSADRQYVRILYLAAYQGEEKVHEILRYLMNEAQPITAAKVEELAREELEIKDASEVHVEAVNLSVYDELVSGSEVSA